MIVFVENQRDSTDNLIGDLNKLGGGIKTSTTFLYISNKYLESIWELSEISGTQE